MDHTTRSRIPERGFHAERRTGVAQEIAAPNSDSSTLGVTAPLVPPTRGVVHGLQLVFD